MENMTDEVDIGNIVGRALGESVSCEALMDMVIERLKILNYESSFCDTFNYDKIHPAKFLTASNNQATQFQLFRDLCKWLFFQCKIDSGISESDDPDTVITKIMSSLKSINFQGSFPPQKLKTPFGAPTLMVLDFLTQESLTAYNFKVRDFKFDPDIQKDPEILDSTVPDDDIKDDTFYVEEETKRSDTKDYSYYEEVKSNIDPYQWKAELDRVTPKLKMPTYPFGKEWRSHLEQSQENTKIINQLQSEVSKALKSLSIELDRQLDIINQKEKTLNIQYTNIVQSYQTVNNEVNDTLKEITSLNEIISTYENDNVVIKEKLSELKDIMGTNKGKQGDTAPIVRIKKAMQNLRKDIYLLNTQIGVVSHAINHARSRTNADDEEIMNVSIEDDDSSDGYGRSKISDSDSSDY